VPTRSLGCSEDERVGPASDGGKWLCNPDRLLSPNVRRPASNTTGGDSSGSRSRSSRNIIGGDPSGGGGSDGGGGGVTAGGGNGGVDGDDARPRCAVLSVGSNNDFRFEAAVAERWGCTVHVYDASSSPPLITGTGMQIILRKKILLIY